MTRSFAVLVAAFALSAAVVAWLQRNRARLPADTPNARSLHAGAVPRGGGLAILAGFVPAALVAPPGVPGAWPLWLAATAAVAAVSFADDVRSLPAWVRLVVQLGAALVVALPLTTEATSTPALHATFVAIAIAWGANLYNFMDGSDGLAASMTIAGFGAYAIGAAMAGAEWLALASIALATLPFLRVNRPPAAMFMGDVGAVPLGFLAAALGIAGVVRGWWGAWFPLLVFLPFAGDATVTLLRRAARGERVWHAHRTHYYQRLNALGAGHRGTLLAYAAAMAIFATAALACLALRPDAGWIALALGLAAQLTAFAAIDYHGARTTRAPPQSGPSSERER